MATIKGILILLVMAGIGYLAYNYFVGPQTPSVEAYKAFADALVRGDYDKANSLADEEAVNQVTTRRGKPVKEKPSDTRFRNVKERATEDSSEVEATQVVRDSIGMTRNRYQKASLKLLGGNWKVVNLSETVDAEMESLK